MSNMIEDAMEIDGLNPDYKELCMFEQLGKVIDSKGTEKPRDWVVTDDGDKIKGIKWYEAKAMKDGLLNIPKPSDRQLVQDQIQRTVGFTKVLSFVRKQLV